MNAATMGKRSSNMIWKLNMEGCEEKKGKQTEETEGEMKGETNRSIKDGRMDGGRWWWGGGGGGCETDVK